MSKRDFWTACRTSYYKKINNMSLHAVYNMKVYDADAGADAVPHQQGISIRLMKRSHRSRSIAQSQAQ